jgi:hypothetical protein
LPVGFVPLPTSVLQTAQADIASDVLGGGVQTTTGKCPKAPTTPTTTTTTTSTTTTTTTLAQTTTTAVPPTTTTIAPRVVNTGVGLKTAPPVTDSSHGFTGLGGNGQNVGGTGSGAIASGPGGVLPTGQVQLASLSETSSSVFVPLIGVLALLFLALGGAIVASGSMRRQLLGAAGSAYGRVGRGVGRLLNAVSPRGSGRSGPNRPW